MRYSDLNEQQKRYARDYAQQKLQALYDLFGLGEVKVTDPEVTAFVEDRKYEIGRDKHLKIC